MLGKISRSKTKESFTNIRGKGQYVSLDKGTDAM